MKKNVVLIIIILFLFSLVAHYYPVYKKGYSFNPMGGDLTMARNVALTGGYKIESEKNVILSSVKVKDEGISSNSGNRLNPFVYGQIFKVFGFNQDLPLYVALVVWALAGVILFLIVLKLFNLQVAIIFGLVDIFIPVLTQGSLMPGFYEWPVLFFSLGLFSYFWPSFSKERNKNNWLNLVLASLLFGLAALAKNSFVVSFVPIAVYELWQSRSLKKAIVFILPFILVFGGYLMSGYLTGLPNAYLSSEDTDFGRYGHLFPDPYTYHYENEEYIESIIGTSVVGYTWFLLKYGYPVSLKDKLLRYWHTIRFYPKEFSKLIVLGGPLVILFLIVGLVYLYRKRKSLFKFFVVWGLLWYLLLIYFKSANWDHFLEIRFLLTLLVALGVSWLIDFVLGLSWENKIKYTGLGIISLALLFHLGQANKWMLYEEYKGSNTKTIREMALVVNQRSLDKENEIVAVDGHPTVQSLNYYTDVSIVYFDSETIKKLLNQGKLSWAFEQFGVTKIAGFSPDLGQRISEETGLENIVNWE